MTENRKEFKIIIIYIINSKLIIIAVIENPWWGWWRIGRGAFGGTRWLGILYGYGWRIRWWPSARTEGRPLFVWNLGLILGHFTILSFYRILLMAHCLYVQVSHWPGPVVSLGFTACNLNSKISERLIEWQYCLNIFDFFVNHYYILFNSNRYWLGYINISKFSEPLLWNM